MSKKVFCICCNFEIEPLNKEVDGLWNDGAVGVVYAGYGSRFDDTFFQIAICDNCLEKKLSENKIIQIERVRQQRKRRKLDSTDG